MTPRNILTTGAFLVALATLVLAGIEVARRFNQDTSLYEVLFAISAVATALVCIGVLDWARNLGGRAPRRGGDEDEEREGLRGGDAADGEPESSLVGVVHRLGALGNDELSGQKTIDEALRLAASFAGATTAHLWTMDDAGHAVVRSTFSDGVVLAPDEGDPRSVDDQTLQKVIEHRQSFQSVGEEKASLVVPLAMGRRCVGVLDLVVPVEGSEEECHDEAQRVAGDLDQLAPHVARAVQAPDLYEQAVTDAITGLYTRRHFINQLTEATGASRRYGESLSLLLLDVDNFGMCNRTRGKATGDRVLHGVAMLVGENIREADTAYRYGADEVAVILPETDIDRAARLGERLRSVIRASRTLCDDGDSIITTVSMGLAEFDEDMRGIGPLMSHAEEALYVAKTRGRDRVEKWTEGAAGETRSELD